MRPGPGLVVMALAFISGARRGSTSSISSKTTTTTTTTSSPPPPLILETTTTTPSSTSPLRFLQNTFTTTPHSSNSFSSPTATASTTTIGTGVTTTTTTTPLPSSTQQNFGFQGTKLYGDQQDDHYQHQLSKRPKAPVSFDFLNTFFAPNSYSSFPSTSNDFAYTQPLPSHLTQYNDDPRIRANSKSALPATKQSRRAITKFRRRRRKRRANRFNVDSSTRTDDATENLNDSDDTLTSLTTAVDSSSDRTTVARGLHVHFPSQTAPDSSTSFDEDDIFALVAEDDLLSEESFDHLVKLTNDKIGDTNEEDYSSGTETVVESSSGSGSGAPDNVQDTPDQQNSIPDFGYTHPSPQTDNDKQQQQRTQNDNSNRHRGDDADDIDERGVDEQPHETHDSEQDIVDTVYNAHLVANSNEEVVSLTEADSTYSIHPIAADKERRQVTTTSTSSTHLKAELESANKYRTILESDFALTRLNPWISACDLAQPGPTSAPDLQGECSAGTLPVAWVDEGPGPPTCLKSCKEETPYTNKLNKDNMINNLINNNSNNNKNNKKNNNKNDNKLNKLVGYTTTTNTFNIKLRNSQPTTSHSVNANDNSNSNRNSNTNDNSNHKKKNIDSNNNNNSNNNKFSNIIQKLLNPFNYYQINNSNNNKKMPKTRRNPKETSSLIRASEHKDEPLNATQRNELKESQSQALSVHSSEDYDLLHDMLMQQDAAGTNEGSKHDDHQFNDAAIAVAAVAMQLNQQQQQQQQNHNNNDIVKTKVAATNYNDHNRQQNNQNNQNNQFELKYNHIKYDHNANSESSTNNNNNNRRYHNSNINNSQLRSVGPAAAATTTTASAVAVNNRNNDQYLKITPPEKQQQQCLEYLGDSDKTMPTHLCHQLTPSDRLAQLRHLRLPNCCERNVYSALHTLALNATLSGGTGCLRVLEDLMDLDALASRITCGLTEILFRFDCRQVYSIVHQCDDCKEAYRRWVCSTLVPYFAETSDVMRPPEILTSTIESINLSTTGINGDDANSHSESYNAHANTLNSSNTTTMASNMTTSHSKATLPNSSNSNNNNSNNNNNNATDISSAIPLKLVTSNFITNSNNNEHDIQYDANNYQQHFYMLQQQQQNEQHHIKRRSVQQQQQKQHYNPNHKLPKKNNSNASSNNNKINDFYYRTILIHHKNQPQQPQQQQQHSAISIISSSQALTFHDIIAHNSSTTSPRNNLRSSINRQRINETDKPTFGHYFHDKSTNKRHKRSDNSPITTTTKTTTAAIYADNVVNRPAVSLSSSSSSSSSPSTLHRMQRQKQQLQPQPFNFISSANNADSFYPKNPVITKLLKRTKRKEFEFRKRRRIRPCLSVCQTVEQKCPYLLPADRAPSMPTQYAGEPTFLCLDYNIAETEEQLKKASHGPNDCCYTYCSNSADGICTYCDEMWDKTEIDREADILSEENEMKVFNISMQTKLHGKSAATIRVETKIQQKLGEEMNGLKMSTVAIAVRNDTAFENATRLAERLQYYAFCDGVFYYDNDANDMPDYPDSGNCRKLPPVQSRCSIPYYATNYISSADMLGSYRKHNEAQKLLIWLSTLLCLWSCYSARSMRMGRYNEDKRQQQQLTNQQHSKLINTAFKGLSICQSCQTREIMQNEGNSIQKNMILWYDYRESRVLIIYWLKVKSETESPNVHKKSLNEKPLIVRHLRQIQRGTIAKINLKILEIPSLTLLINYKEVLLLLLFKKRQKLRKRKIIGLMLVHESSWWFNVNGSSGKSLKSTLKPKLCSFNTNKIHDYYYYYYCSCSQIFSCSCNENMKNNNNYYDNIKYIKKFKYNFSTCNFNKNNTKGNSSSSSSSSSSNSNTKDSNSNNRMTIMMMLMKFDYKKVALIKFNTTTTTHKRIITSYNTNSSNNNTYCYNIIIIIIMSYNIYNNFQNPQTVDSLNKLKPNISHHHYYCCHYHYHYYLYDNYSDYYNYLYKIKFKLHKMINSINVLLKTSTLPLSLPLPLPLPTTSTLTITNPLYNLITSNMFTHTMFMIVMMILKMLILLIMPLLFKSFMKMKYNNNHHMKNIIKLKLKLSLSPNTSYNSKEINYRYSYYYNFNINDWWQRRRWWRRRRRLSMHQIVVNSNNFNSRQLLLWSGHRTQIIFFAITSL